MRQDHTLTAKDWIAAGFRALTAGGPQAIKIEAIARELAVSKGSFYWHFKNAPVFKRAMLSHWIDTATNRVIGETGEGAPDPREQLRRLVKIATSGRSDPYGGKLAEAAIRDWAHYDADAASALKAADCQRLQFLRTIFAASGVPEPRVTAFASIFFAAFIGLEQLHHHQLADAKADLTVLLNVLLDASHP